MYNIFKYPPPIYHQQYVNHPQHVNVQPNGPAYLQNNPTYQQAYYPQHPQHPQQQQPVYAQNPQAAYGYPPQPAPQYNQPIVQNVLGPQGLSFFCPVCNKDTQSIQRKVPGGVTYVCCLALCLFTGILCCVPFCIDTCQDTELVCLNCQKVKTIYEATAL